MPTHSLMPARRFLWPTFLCLAVMLPLTAVLAYSSAPARADGSPDTKRIVLVPLSAAPASAKRALVVGVDDYQNAQKLTDCGNDARAFAVLLQSKLGFSHVTVMTDDAEPGLRPTYTNLRHQFKLVLDTVVPDRTEVVVFYSGHGTRGDGDADWLVPEDGDPGDVAGTCFNYTQFKARLEGARPARALLVMDACRNLLGGKGAGGSGFGAKRVALGPQVAELQSCQPTQVSREGRPGDFPESVFTHFLVKGLSGDPGAMAADGKDVTFDSLKTYVQEQVSQYVADKFSDTQLPAGTATLGGMVLVRPSALVMPASVVPALMTPELQKAADARLIALWTDEKGARIDEKTKSVTLAAVRQALDAGADKEAKDKDGHTVLMMAAQGGHADAVQALLDAGADKDARDKIGGTPLMLAAQVGHADVVKVLLDAGADKEVRTKDGVTALILAAVGGHADAVKLLLQAGADKDAMAKGGLTALILASQGGYVDTVQALLAAGADKDVVDKDLMTPLMWAAQGGYLDVVQALLAAGADKDAGGKNGMTALMMAAAKGQTVAVKALLDAGADKEIRSRTGMTALMAAAMVGQVDPLKALLAAGADADAKSDAGITALMVAAIAGQANAVQALLAAGANKDATDKSGRTALAYANVTIPNVKVSADARAATIAVLQAAGAKP